MVTPVGHTLSYTRHEADCTEEGFTEFNCSVCDYSFVSEHTPPHGHSFEKEITSPTCTKAGYTTYTCNECGYSYSSDLTAPPAHTFSKEVIAPTCTDEGCTVLSCAVCGKTYITDYTAPHGHNFTTKKVNPTSSQTGYTVFHCSLCEYEYVGDYVWRSDIFKGAYVDGSKVYANGVDVSKHNGNIDWTALKNAGVDFAIIRAGYSGVKDPYFETNYKNAKAAGIDVGAYYYTYAKSVEQSLRDAVEFESWLAGKKFEYPVFLDIEDDSQISLGKETLTQMCIVFIERLQADGYFGALYTNNNWLVNYLETEKVTTLFDIWYARYPASYQPEWSDKYGDRMCMWQYSDRGTFEGNTAQFDLDIAFKDYPSLIKQWHYNGY